MAVATHGVCVATCGSPVHFKLQLFAFELFACSHTPLLPVRYCPIGTIAEDLKDKVDTGGTSCAAFANKKIIPVFMTEAYKDEEVNRKLRKSCKELGVVRFLRSGSAISRVC